MSIEVKNDPNGKMRIVKIDLDNRVLEVESRTSCFKHIAVSEKAFQYLQYMKKTRGLPYCESASRAIEAVYQIDVDEDAREGY
jgi:hypothetical protein